MRRNLFLKKVNNPRLPILDFDIDSPPVQSLSNVPSNFIRDGRGIAKENREKEKQLKEEDREEHERDMEERFKRLREEKTDLLEEIPF